MEIGFFSRLPVAPMLNLPFASLRAGSPAGSLTSRCAWEGRGSSFCCPLRVVCCHSSVPKQTLTITPGEQRWGAGWTGRAQS